jgi:hypothetical protein
MQIGPVHTSVLDSDTVSLLPYFVIFLFICFRLVFN